MPTSLLQRQRPLGFVLLLLFVALGSFAEALGSCRERFCSPKTAWPLGPKQKEPPVVSQHGNGCHKLDGCLSGHKLGHQFLEKTMWKKIALQLESILHSTGERHSSQPLHNCQAQEGKTCPPNLANHRIACVAAVHGTDHGKYCYLGTSWWKFTHER